MNFFHVQFSFDGAKDGSKKAQDAVYRADKLVEITLLQCQGIAGSVATVDALGELSYYIKTSMELLDVRSLLTERFFGSRITGVKLTEVDPMADPSKALHGTVKSYLKDTDLKGV
jgi:hypothetical protein